jgi:YidC/Oxa1 family membrane protein insertase
MQGEQKNFIIAIVLSILIIIGWQIFYVQPQMEKQQPAQNGAPAATGGTPASGDAAMPQAPAGGASAPSAAGAAPGTVPGSEALRPRELVLAETPRVRIDTPSLVGSINLRGGRLDDLRLRKYRETVDPDSPIITLLNPAGTRNAYFSESGWAPAAGSNVKVPGPSTLWKAPQGAVLKVGQPLTIEWDNGEGLIFRRTFTVDENYMFTVTQTVENTGDRPVVLYPYARVQRHGVPPTQGFFVLHEGLIGVLDGELYELAYKDLMEETGKPVEATSAGGWVGITDKYWAVTVIPANQKERIRGRFFHQKSGGRDIFQADWLGLDGITVAPGQKAEHTTLTFAGAKVVALVDEYASRYGIQKFDLLIDWGWFYFITRPMFWLLHTLQQWLGNYGLAILVATVLIKLLLFPLSNKSYASMAEMKKLQPELERIRELYKDDKLKQQQAMMELYRKHKVSPMAGCLPMLVQIPIFFALYKVLFVTIDMRHAPFVGWIRDLSAPDPTSIFNLFGLIPWDPPLFLQIGVLPLLMGITMWVQMKLNPPPPDPVQARLFDLMPIIFTFMLATFPAGLVLYWAWNNLLSIIQQAYIMKKHGAEIHLWENLKNSLPFLKRKAESRRN